MSERRLRDASDPRIETISHFSGVPGGTVGPS